MGATTDLVQQLIRNACVNDGTLQSGQETRSVDTIAAHLAGSGLDLQRFESAPGRESLVARIEGSDPDAPSLLLLGHTDVVPVNPEFWREDPFGGDIIDGELWGRGAIDMLNLTASMAESMRRWSVDGFRPTGDIIYAAVADEEALGTYGADFLANREADAVRADYVITETGGMPMPSPDGIRLPALVAEKGALWTKLVVRGVAGHGSLPFRTDNALVKAAEVVRRIADHRPATRISDIWRGFVAGLGLPEEVARPLLHEEGFTDFVGALPIGLSRLSYSCTHTTMAPTVLHLDGKTNVIPDRVELELDVRALPGDGPDEIRVMLCEALGDLAAEVEIGEIKGMEATVSPMDTPLWDAMQRS